MTKDVIIKKYLGATFLHLGRNSAQGLDCWGFIKCVYKDAGIELFDLDSYAPDWARRGQNFFLKNYYLQWELVPRPQFLDIILIQTAGLVNHAGIVLDDERFIHCCKAGIVISPITEFVTNNRVAGYYRFKRDDQNSLSAQPVRETGRC